METILIITKKEILSDSSQGCPQVRPGQVCAQPGLDLMTRVGEIKTHNRLVWSFGSAKLGLVGFGCISGSFKFAIGGGNLARFWPKSSQISTNLAESIKIWPIFLHILRDLAEISLYLSRSSHYISGILNLDLLVFHRNTRLEPRSHYICR